MKTLPQKMGLLAFGVGLLLLVPLVAMRFTDEVEWSVADFAAAAGLLFCAGSAYLAITHGAPQRRSRRQRHDPRRALLHRGRLHRRGRGRPPSEGLLRDREIRERPLDERSGEVEVRAVSAAEVRSADEIWVTSSTKEVLAVTTLDGKPVGDGKPGPLFRRMHALYQQFKQEHMRTAA